MSFDYLISLVFMSYPNKLMDMYHGVSYRDIDVNSHGCGQ